MEPDLKEFEEELERLAPAALPEGLIARMEAAMDGWQDAEREEKVVPFPAKEDVKFGGGLWKAAAAVAILGAAVALLIPAEESSSTTVASISPSSNSRGGWVERDVAPVSFSPLSAERDVVRTDSQGMIMMKGDTPHRCVRVEYMEHYEFKGEDGQTLRVSKPAVNYVLIPVRPD